MKYLFKMIGLGMLLASAAACYLFLSAYYWLLYPLYHFRWHAEPWAWIPKQWADFTLEIEEFWRGTPLFYPGWTFQLTDEECAQKIKRHYASYLAYCRQEKSYNPK